ncbi:MAG: RNA polymerase sigma factor [Saprospiraceae bacterium]|nr:RNA polymerase sigma factor [Saprospiraceae bacterium]
MTIQEYNRTVELYADNLYRFLLKKTRDKNDADDLVQITFEKLWLNREKVRMDQIKAYIFRIGYNAMIDMYRKTKRLHYSEQVPDKGQSPDVKTFELKEWINEGLKILNEDQKSVLLLRDYEGYSYKEISDITGLTESQVKVYIFRARKKMKEFFQQKNRTDIVKYGH